MKFNVLKKAAKVITNYEGARAFKLSPEVELYTSVVTTALSGAFYESAGERLQRIRKLITEVDPVFVAQLAIYAREQMHLRSSSFVTAFCF